MQGLIFLVSKHWKYLVILALTISLVFSVFTISQKNLIIEQVRTSSELEITKLEFENNRVVRKMEREHYEKQIQAINAYKEREEAILADAASANDAVNKLSDTINEISATAKLDANLRSRYIDTSNNILKECTAEYSKMGQIADRLSNEVRLLSDANRRR